MAQDAAQQCVARQLQLAGLLSQSARDTEISAAIEVFRASTPLPSSRPYSHLTASIFCRDIGLTNPQYAEIWPSRPDPILVRHTASVDGFQARAVERALQQLLTFLAQSAEFEPALQIHALVVTSSDEARTLMANRPNIPNYAMSADTIARCDSAPRAWGAAWPDLILICVRPDAFLSLGRLRQVAIHEGVHAIQYQLAGVSPGFATGAPMIEDEGPFWLIEGTADIVESYLFEPNEIQEEVQRRWEELPQPVRIDLQALNSAQALTSETRDLFYNAAFLATFVLLSQPTYDRGDWLRFYQDLGHGHPWETAFSNGFGVSVEEFYADFETFNLE